uniref:Uncharacterized protein n=1 Tax=Rhizophora mucronata TaxID=61149 RepID=A0A2P2QAN6_RHIMU
MNLFHFHMFVFTLRLSSMQESHVTSQNATLTKQKKPHV